MNRKGFFALALVVMGFGLSMYAQRPVDDTIYGREASYYYDKFYWRDYDTNCAFWYAKPKEDALYDASGSFLGPCYRDIRNSLISTGEGDPAPAAGYTFAGFYFQHNGNKIVGNRMVADRPLKILGVAACGYMQEARDTTIDSYMYMYSNPGNLGHLILPNYGFLNTRDTVMAHRETEYLRLYQITGGNDLVLLGSKPWSVTDPHRYMVIPVLSSSGALSGHIDSAVAIYEVLFDKPVVVMDTFVVAGTTFNNEGGYSMECAPINENLRRRIWLWDRNPTRYWSLLEAMNTSDECADSYYNFSQLWLQFRNLPWKAIPNDSTCIPIPYYNSCIAIFPIIDTTFDTVLFQCEEVTNVRVVASGGDSAVMAWDATNTDRWEVRYCPAGMSTDSCTVVRVTSPTATLTGLLPGRDYTVQVRGWCDEDSSYSEWSQAVTVAVDEPQGIEEPGDLGRFTYLMPNPTSGAVSVVSSYSISRIKVYDLGGRVVMEQQCEGLSASLDVSGLASGTYIVAIHTPAGVATKKLEVAF